MLHPNAWSQADFKVSRVGQSKQYYLRVNDKALYVSELVAVIVEGLHARHTVAEITATVNQRALLSRPLSELGVENIIEHTLVPLLLAPKEAKPTKFDDLQCTVTLLTSAQLKRLLRFGAPLFSPRLFYSLLLILALLNVTLLAGSSLLQIRSGINLAHGVVALILFAPVMLLHELGHAAAAFRYHVMPKEIGAGIYLVCPVFFADVTDVWSLPSAPRIVVNLAGIFVQLFVNVLLLIAMGLTITDSPVWPVTAALVCINTFSLATNLLPFMKLDGYWVYADFFNVPNLRADAKGFLSKLVRTTWRGQRPAVALPVLFYCLGRALFAVLCAALLCKWIWIVGTELTQAAQGERAFTDFFSLGLFGMLPRFSVVILMGMLIYGGARRLYLVIGKVK